MLMPCVTIVYTISFIIVERAASIPIAENTSSVLLDVVLVPLTP